MSSLFNFDSPFMRFLEKAANLLIINLLWAVCSIPIVTLGASTTAMYYVTMKIVRDEDDYVVRSFFSSFTKNFKQSTKIWIVLLIVLLLVGCNLYYYINLIEGMDQFRKIVCIFEIILLILWSMIVLYIFPLIARFENTTKQIIYNAFVMSITNLLYTAMMLITSVVIIVIGFKLFPLFGVTFAAWLNSYLLHHKIFKRYITESEE